MNKASRPEVGSKQPLVQWVTQDIIPRVRRPRRDADNQPPYNAEVRSAAIPLIHHPPP
jgi:hypothetical protein